MCRSSTGRSSLPSRTEDLDQPSTLPPEELNPLINPLLAQNMGRWAEVYFTALPENREQAVLDLLCELREKASLPQPASASEAAHPPADSSVSVSDGTSVSTPFVRCPECGYENRSDHNFCGSCRAELKNPASAMAFFDALVPTTDQGEAQRDAPQAEAQSLTSEVGEQLTIDHLEIERRRFEQRKWKLDQPAHLESSNRQNDDRQSDDRQSSVRPPMIRPAGARQNDVDLFRFSRMAERPRSYRIYIAAAVGIVVLFLLYRVWWGRPTTAGKSHIAPQVSSAVTSETSGPATVPGRQSSSTSATDAAGSSPAPVAEPARDSTRPAKPASISKPDASLQTVAHNPNPTAQPAPAPAAAADAEGLPLWGNGAAELSLAKSYLNGTDGKEPNSAEAAALLWKAVAKQNAEATELLSDLYLKGDGVSKSCDQARILLDAAARKGRKAAGERLSHLEAFGCQ